MTSRIISRIVLFASPLLAASAAQAAIISLTDGNSTALLDPASSAGMLHWDVQGQNELVQQWFWYRIGNAGPELPINAISAPVVSQTANSAVVTYAGAGFSVSVRYQLTGGLIVANGQIAQADVAETVTINNLGSAPLNFHLFEYSNFDLDGPGNDTVQLSRVGAPLRFISADQWEGPNPTTTLTETVVSPKAGHGDAGIVSATLNLLNDGLPTTLTDALGPTGPGDVTWALQWDFTGAGGVDYSLIAPNSSQIISKDKTLNVLINGSGPEPASLFTLVAGAATLLLRRRRSLLSH